MTDALSLFGQGLIAITVAIALCLATFVLFIWTPLTIAVLWSDRVGNPITRVRRWRVKRAHVRAMRFRTVCKTCGAWLKRDEDCGNLSSEKTVFPDGGWTHWRSWCPCSAERPGGKMIPGPLLDDDGDLDDVRGLTGDEIVETVTPALHGLRVVHAEGMSTPVSLHDSVDAAIAENGGVYGGLK